MASRIKVDEVTNTAGSESVSFPAGGASFTGNVNITGNLQVNGNTTLGDATSDTVTINAAPTIINNDGLNVYSATNAPTNGAQIKFSDQTSRSQSGFIRYKHTDGAVSPGSNDGFLVGGSETLTVFRVVGRVLASEKIGIATDAAGKPLDVYGNVQFGSKSTADAELVIGRDGSGNRNAYIDFVGDNTYLSLIHI